MVKGMNEQVEREGLGNNLGPKSRKRGVGLHLIMIG